MTVPVREPTDQRDIQTTDWRVRQLARRPVGGQAFPGEWQTPTLVNDWEQPPDGYEEHQFRLAADGGLEFKGFLDGGAAASGTVAYTLPSGYRGTDRGRETEAFGTTGRDATNEELLPTYVEIDATSGDVTIYFCSCPEGT